MIGCLISSKVESSSAKPRAWISGPPDDLAADRVDDHDHRDEALLAEDPAVLEVGLGDVADRGAVDEDVAAVDLAGDRGHAVDEVDDDAVLGDDDVVVGDAGRAGQRRRWRACAGSRRGPGSTLRGRTML